MAFASCEKLLYVWAQNPAFPSTWSQKTLAKGDRVRRHKQREIIMIVSGRLFR